MLLSLLLLLFLPVLYTFHSTLVDVIVIATVILSLFQPVLGCLSA